MTRVPLPAALAWAAAAPRRARAPIAGAAGAGPVRVMLLGDSITVGIAMQEPQAIASASPAGVEFVGSQVTGKGVRHEGHVGWTSGRILSHLDGWIASARPDVVLFMIGTNDVNDESEPIEHGIANVRAIVDRVRNAGAVVAISQIPYFARQATRWAAWNQALTADAYLQRAVARWMDPATGYPSSEGLHAGDISGDGVHPTGAGYGKLDRMYGVTLQLSLGGGAADQTQAGAPAPSLWTTFGAGLALAGAAGLVWAISGGVR